MKKSEGVGSASVVAPSSPRPGATPSLRSLAKSSVRGSMVTLAGFAGGQFVRLGGNLILTRLVFPEVFGQMALVYVFIQGLALFSDVGTGPAVIQSPRGDDPDFLNTAWTIQCIRGGVLWACTFVIAAPVASFYGQPRLAWLLPAAGLGAAIDGFFSLSIQLSRRHLKLGRLTLVDLTCQFAGIASNIAFVLVYRSMFGADHPGVVWAIVAGGLVSEITRLVLSHTVLPGIRHRFLLDRNSATLLFQFGRWVLVSTMLSFLAGQSDRMIFGKLLTIDMLGVYGIAAMLATLPTQAVVGLGGAVIFPALSRIAGRPDFRRQFWRTRLPLLAAGGVLVTGLIASGPYLIRILYDRRYQDAGWILQYLAVMAWFQILEATNSAAVMAQGRVAWVAGGNFLKLAGLASLIPIGFHLAGLQGALVGLIGAEFLRYLVSTVAAARRGLHSLWADAGLTSLIAVLSWLALMAGTAASRGPHAQLLGFLAAGSVAAIPWGAAALWFFRYRRSPG